MPGTVANVFVILERESRAGQKKNFQKEKNVIRFLDEEEHETIREHRPGIFPTDVVEVYLHASIGEATESYGRGLVVRQIRKKKKKGKKWQKK
jgi:hypothetical protein